MVRQEVPNDTATMEQGDDLFGPVSVHGGATMSTMVMSLPKESPKIGSGSMKMAQTPQNSSPSISRSSLDVLAQPKAIPKTSCQRRSLSRSPDILPPPPARVGSVWNSRLAPIDGEGLESDSQASSRVPSRAGSRPMTGTSENVEGFSRMLASVSACVRAIEKNVFELDDFLGAWIGQDGEGAPRKVVAPPSGVVMTRLQVTMDGLQAVRGTLDGMSEKLKQGAGGTPASSRPHTRGMLDGVGEHHVEFPSAYGEFHSSHLDIMRLGTPTFLNTTPPQTRGAMGTATRFGTGVKRLAGTGLREKPKSAGLEGGCAGPLGSKSEQNKAVKLECLLKERLTAIGLSSDCMLTDLDLRDKLAAPAVEAYIKLLERIAGECGPYSRLLRRLCMGLQNALFVGANCQLCVLDLLRQGESCILELKEEISAVQRQLEEKQVRRDEEDNNTMTDIKERKQRRKRMRMQKRDAKEHVEKLKTYEALVAQFTAVDMFAFILKHLRQSPKMQSSLSTATKKLQQFLGEIDFPGDPHKPEAEQVLTKVLEACLLRLHELRPAELAMGDADKTMWRLKDKDLFLNLQEFEQLQFSIDESINDARMLAAKAHKVIKAWNRAGLNPEDAESSGEEEEDGSSSKALKAEVLGLRKVIEMKNREIDEVKDALNEGRKSIELFNKEKNLQQDEEMQMKNVLYESMVELRKEAQDSGILSLWNGFPEPAIRSLSSMQLELTNSHQEVVNSLGKLCKKMDACTPRPVHSEEELQEAAFVLEMQGLHRKLFASTSEYESTLTKKLASALEEITYLRNLIVKSKDLENPEVASRMSEKKAVKFIQARGFGADVPAYLRWKGKVRLRMIGKRETELLLQQLWHEKEGRGNVPMEEHFTTFLKARFGSDSMVAEWGYNLIHALEQHKYDADCELFLAVLQGTVSEKVKKESERMIATVKSALEMCDQENHDGEKGKLEVEQMMMALRSLFAKTKANDEFSELQSALQRSVKESAQSPLVPYALLFENTDEFTQTPFVEMLRDQYLHEIIEFTVEVEEAIRDRAVKNVNNDVYEIGGYDAFRAIKLSDSTKPEEEIEEWVRIAAKCKQDDSNVFQCSYELERFISTLRSSVEVKRTSKPAAALVNKNYVKDAP